MNKPKVFVGSSSEQLKLAQKIEVWLDETGCKPVLWTGIFEPGDYTAERLIAQAHDCDGAIMIFGEDDKTWFREEHLNSPRDNVLYELGLFTGAAKDNALKRVIFLRVGDSKVASDLKGLVYVPVDRDDPIRPKIREEIHKFAERLKVDARPIDPSLFKITGKRELFLAGTNLIQGSANRVTLAAKTPVPLMGPRPYDRVGPSFEYEKQQYERYWAVAERAARGELDFTLIASIPSIIEDMQNCDNAEFHRHIDQNLQRLFSLASGKASKLHVYWHEGLCPPAFLIADGIALIWWKGGNGDSIWIAHNSNELAEALSSSRPGSYTKLRYEEVSDRIKKSLRTHAA
ncbi:MAG: nucleotide-binding protein [Proteobacteria bacterium]|nr:nucleotide-binding protein [Pseudomonadota bacterium]